MALKIERVDGTPERKVVLACLIDKHVLGRVAAKWSPSALPSKWACLVVGWAVDYYKEWKRAPAHDVQTQFEMWRPTANDPATVELVAAFLETISGDHKKLKEGINAAYTLDVADGLMKRVQSVELRDKLTAYIEADDIEKAVSTAVAFRPVELNSSSWIDVRADEAAMVEAFDRRSEVLIEYPDALGKFFGRSLERDGFVAILAPEKRGKSQWLMDMAWRAVEQGRRVAYFEAGDMSRDQVLRRLGVRAAGRPQEGNPLYPFKIPILIDAPAKRAGLASVEYRDDYHKKNLTGPEAHAAVQKHLPPDRFRLSVHPNSSISVYGIEAEIDSWRRDGFAIDVCFIDYSDILAPLDKKADVRDQINQTWKALRALSQKYNCLVVTATQSDAESYDAHSLGRRHFSEDKRKYAHVTGMFGLNQSPKTEKEPGIYRLNWIVLRDGEYSENDFVYVAGNLAIGQPALVSTF